MCIKRYIWTTQLETKPKYFMTKRQLICLERLRDAAAPEKFRHNIDGTRDESIVLRRDRRRQALEDTCMLFSIAIFDRELKDSEFKSGIISELAVLSIDTRMRVGRWH